MIRLIPVLVLLLSGCALLASRAPDIHLADAQLVRSGLLTQGWELQLVLSNHNWRPLTLRDLEYAVHLDGQPLVTDLHVERLRLPARSRTRIKVPINSFVGTRLKRRRLSNHVAGEPVHYRVLASARWGDGESRRAFSSDGSLRLPIYP